MLKRLVKDSVIYGAANTVQKLVPFFIIPIITTYLGQEALKVYDVSFVYAYVFSWLIILGQDSASGVLYFDEKIHRFYKARVTTYALLIQVSILLLCFIFLIPFSSFFSGLLFPKDAAVARWWTTALFIIPGHVVLNHSLNILLWQKRKTAYIVLCLVQTFLSIGSVFITVIVYEGGLPYLFYSLIGSSSIAGLAGLILVRKQVFAGILPFDHTLLKRLLILGLPFALTSFLHQLLPLIDRYFLLQFGYGNEMAPYILASKLGALILFGVNAFVLAFTPYSMAKLNEDDAETEISGIFRIVSVIAFIAVPLLLLFKDILVQLFADETYAFSANLLPFFFYGWVFDLFSYFSLLGIYRSQKSYMLLIFLAIGFAITSLLNIVLVPVWGLYGAATGFVAAKAILFFLPLIWMKKIFHLQVDHALFWGSFVLVAAISFLMYRMNIIVNIAMVLSLLILTFFYFRKQLMRTL